MTNPFKVGDKVRVRADGASSTRFEAGQICTVTQVINSYVYLYDIEGGWFYERFELADEIQDHIKALEALGYSITPPQPKVSGEYVVIAHKDTLKNHSTATSQEYEEDKDWYERNGYVVLARLPWTEGDGL